MRKKQFLPLLFLILSLSLIITSVTYAYLKAQVGSGAKTNVNIQSGTVDSLTFDKCNPVNLTMTQTNFGENAGNQEGSTCVKATLTANNTTNTATDTYNVYLDIKENNFEYTTTEQKTEILLQVTDPNGNKVTSIPRLTYDTTLQGFDITTKKGLIQLASNYEIKVNNTSDNPKTQEWGIKIILINLETNQALNAGKTFNAEGIIQKEEKFVTSYWNDSFGNRVFNYPNTPTTRYYTPDEIPELSTKPIYIRTDETSHAACLRYNNKDFCLPWNYGKDMTGDAIKAKLQSDMESAFETTATNCTSYSSYAGCSFGSFFCNAGLVGSVECRDGLSICYVDSTGYALCSY